MNYWSPLFYMHTDYAGFAIPASEGGKGPENARDVLGLEFDHHAGMKTRTLLDGETVEECAYRYVREVHQALTDDNHSWEYPPYSGPADGMRRLDIIKNEKSGSFAIKPWWVEDGPGARWFSQEFRVVTVGIIAAEIDTDCLKTQHYLDEAAAQRDSIRGRKRASELRCLATSARWRGQDAPGHRWPAHAGLFMELWNAAEANKMATPTAA